jgi:DNA-binding GntR family transcriptional regulator
VKSDRPVLQLAPDSAAQGAPTLKELARAAAEQPSTTDLIAAALRKTIVSGAIRGGAQLRQSELAAEFGVSVIPVREALQRLVAEGFVILQRNRGAIVAEVSLSETSELFDLRVALETMLLASAVPQLTAADIERAAHYQRALDEESDINLWGTLNWRFHEALYRQAARPRTLAIVANINQHVDRLLRLQMSLVDGKQKSRREHGAILTACRRGDAQKAVSLLQQHIRGVEAIILRFIAKRSVGSS